MEMEEGKQNENQSNSKQFDDTTSTIFDEEEQNPEQQGQVALVQKQKEDQNKINQLSNALENQFAKFDQDEEMLSKQHSKNISMVYDKAIQSSFKLFDKVTENQINNIESLDVQQFERKTLNLLGLGGKAVSGAVIAKANTSLQRAQIFKNQIQNYCDAADKYFATWEKTQAIILKAYQKKMQAQEKIFYKKIVAHEKKKESELKMLEKYRKQKQIGLQKEMEIQNKAIMLKLKQNQKQIKDQQENVKAQALIEAEKKRMQISLNQKREKLRLEIDEKEKMIKIETETKKQKDRLACEKIKLQQQLMVSEKQNIEEMKKSRHILDLELKKKQMIMKENNNSSIDRQFNSILQVYKLQLADAQKFIENQRRIGKSYTWGCTPPSIVTEGEKRYVKQGTVWYSGR